MAKSEASKERRRARKLAERQRVSLESMKSDDVSQNQIQGDNVDDSMDGLSGDSRALAGQRALSPLPPRSPSPSQALPTTTSKPKRKPRITKNDRRRMEAAKLNRQHEALSADPGALNEMSHEPQQQNSLRDSTPHPPHSIIQHSLPALQSNTQRRIQPIQLNITPLDSLAKDLAFLSVGRASENKENSSMDGYGVAAPNLSQSREGFGRGDSYCPQYSQSHTSRIRSEGGYGSGYRSQYSHLHTSRIRSEGGYGRGDSYRPQYSDNDSNDQAASEPQYHIEGHGRTQRDDPDAQAHWDKLENDLKREERESRRPRKSKNVKHDYAFADAQEDTIGKGLKKRSRGGSLAEMGNEVHIDYVPVYGADDLAVQNWDMHEENEMIDEEIHVDEKRKRPIRKPKPASRLSGDHVRSSDISQPDMAKNLFSHYQAQNTQFDVEALKKWIKKQAASSSKQLKQLTRSNGSEQMRQRARIFEFLQTKLNLHEMTEEEFRKTLDQIDEGEAKRAILIPPITRSQQNAMKKKKGRNTKEKKRLRQEEKEHARQEEQKAVDTLMDGLENFGFSAVA